MTTLAQVFMEQPAPFGWPGGKKNLKHRIIALIPPHKTYVEPFAGAASVFWAKKPSEVEVLNDADPDLMRFYRNIGQVAHCDTAKVAKDWESLKARQDKLTPCEFFSAVKCSYGQGGFKKGQALDSSRCTSGQSHFHKNLSEYQARLRQTKLHQGDWEPVVRRYDAPNTFFYLDPPFHGTGRYYRDGAEQDQLARLAKVLPTLKGKWLLSYDDNPKVRAAFQNGHIRKVQTYYTIAAGDNNRVGKELLISNYSLGRHGMEQGHPDMAQIGPPAWAELHAWADRFAARVGDSCGCGRFAQDATRALHDLVSVKLGKKAMYPETLLEVAKMYQEAAGQVNAEQRLPLCTPAQQKRLERCILALKAKGSKVNPWAVCQASLECARRRDGSASVSNIYPWPEGMFEEDDEEEEGMKKKPERPHFSQSFLDTILHTVIGTATALAVSKTLATPPADIKEGETPPPAPAPVPSVLSPAHVEGDQANVDLGTLLEEIDAILKKPETMGIVDADTLTILRE